MTELTSQQRRDAARLAFSLLDLTSLTNQETDADIHALCENAQWRDAEGHRIHVAALCVYPRFIPLARKLLDERELFQVRIATVTNFPAGGCDIDIAVKETQASVAYGADEVDVVFPYQAFMNGDTETPLRLIQACKAACGTGVQLKVILETGELKTAALIQQASELAIAAGADFIKTSTGKVPVNATPEAADVMLQCISAHYAAAAKNPAPARPVGFKPAGGIRTLEDALVYIRAAERIVGADATRPAVFRLGASSVRGHLVSVLEGAEETQQAGGY
ncbi:deoxyribose-phosphate aldolase [Aliidiomarina sanyensis]|uniref:Deoxyribose-phosphate aldolase n=1 Tax=Aliidiomarina sanyensis TaxID=1249555 RepID=A0A432WPJ1_9GAMM|nr:deoxyribose-phosphate aldolase [Aliidiomarina sanyensis]RUO35730.1 deoxyribose-phosphate aldolase [Aliidiomarina sanyensis]